MKVILLTVCLVSVFSVVACAQSVTTSTAAAGSVPAPSTGTATGFGGSVPTTPPIVPVPPKPQTGKVDKREQNQKGRIKNGVQNGDLNAKETVRLLKQQAEIRRSERQAKADGTVTFKERVNLHRDLNKAGRNIKRKKNN